MITAISIALYAIAAHILAGAGVLIGMGKDYTRGLILFAIVFVLAAALQVFG